MFRRLVVLASDPLKLLIILQLTVVLFWWRMWKLPNDSFYTTWEHLSNHQANILLVIVNLFLSITGVCYIVFSRKYYLPIYSIFLTLIFIINGLYFHHDMFTTAILFTLVYLENKKQWNLINSFAAAVMMMAALSKLNPSFLSGEVIREFLAIDNELVLGFISVLVVILEASIALFYLGIIKNKYSNIVFISFHYFMGLILARGLVFNALFVYLIQRKSSEYKEDNKHYEYSIIYFIIAFLSISIRIISSQT